MSTPQFLGRPVTPKTGVHPYHDVKLVGRFVTLVGVESHHAPSLYREIGGVERTSLWDYMMNGPFADIESFQAMIDSRITPTDPTHYTILSNAHPDPDAPEGIRAVGLVSLHRIDMPNRVVEVGHVIYGGLLGRSAAATEAQYLLAKHVFEDLGFRRYEWKANALNKRSDRSARRLGFTYEGTFRQHILVKDGKLNRDTIWFSMLDGEWEDRKKAFEAWLSEDNFDVEGKQKRKLEDFRGQN